MLDRSQQGLVVVEAGRDAHAAVKPAVRVLFQPLRSVTAASPAPTGVTVTELLKSGSDPTARNKPGSTPFHLAVQNTGRGGSGEPAAINAQREIIQAFLARGVSPKLKNGQGKSVLEGARSPWIREMLGAPPSSD